MKYSEFFNQAEYEERETFTKGMASIDVRKLRTGEETSVHRENAGSKRNNIRHSHKDINSDTVISNILEQMNGEAIPDVDTCPVQNSCHTESNKSQNIIHAVPKDSTAFENEETILVLSCNAKINSESHVTLRNTACNNERIDCFGIKTDLSNSEQCNIEADTTEINRNSLELELYSNDPSIPKYFINYIEGLGVYGDSQCPLDLKPIWLDIDKFRRGQKVALKYFFGIQFAQMLSLIVLFNFPDGLESLIFTGNSDTPFKSFKRYLSTTLTVRSWYLDDLWNSETGGHKNLRKVRAMHESLRKNLKATDKNERDRRSTLSGKYDSDCPAIWSTLHKKIREDFEEICPHPKMSQFELLKLCQARVDVSQTEMSFTQFGFVGLFIMFPAYFGAHSITHEELDSFVHLWRCIGYLLGMEDKYNFCNGDLKTVRQKINDLTEIVVKPNLRLVTQDWEHMTRCVTEGVSYYIPGVTFEVSLLYLCNIFGLYTPRLWAALSFKQKFRYYVTNFLFRFILRLPGTMEYYNRLIHKFLKRAKNTPLSTLKRWKEKIYPYQDKSMCS